MSKHTAAVDTTLMHQLKVNQAHGSINVEQKHKQAIHFSYKNYLLTFRRQP